LKSRSSPIFTMSRTPPEPFYLLRLEFVERPPGGGPEKSQEEPDPGGAIPRELLPAAPDGG